MPHALALLALLALLMVVPAHAQSCVSQQIGNTLVITNCSDGSRFTGIRSGDITISNGHDAQGEPRSCATFKDFDEQLQTLTVERAGRGYQSAVLAMPMTRFEKLGRAPDAPPPAGETSWRSNGSSRAPLRNCAPW